MKEKSFVIVLMVVCMAGYVYAGTVDVPAWSVSDWFTVGQTIGVTAQIVGGIEMSGSFSLGAGNWEVVDRTVKYLPQCGVACEVYVLAFDEVPVTGTGAISLAGDVLRVPLEFRNGTAHGEAWIQTENLNPVFYSISASMQSYAVMCGIEVRLDDIVLHQVALEFCPSMEDFQWPLSLGKNWGYDLRIYLHTDFDDMDLPYVDLPQGAGSSWAFRSDVHMDGGVIGKAPVNNCQTYQIVMNSDEGDTLFEHFYCPTDLLWYARKHIYNITYEDCLHLIQLNIDEITWNVTDAHHRFDNPPSSAHVSVALQLNQAVYRAGDHFVLDLGVTNSESAPVTADTYIILDVNGAYYAWPSWSLGDNGLDHITQTFGVNTSHMNILTFDWPGSAGNLSNLKFWAALMREGSLEAEQLIGNVGVVEFSAE